MSKLWYLKHVETIVGTTCGDVFSAMADRGVRRSFDVGETIFTPFDGEGSSQPEEKGGAVYVLESGRATVYESVEGNTFVLDVLCPGDLFGDFRPFPSTTSLLSSFARAEDSSDILVLPRSDFLTLLRDDPELSLCLIQLLSERLHVQESRLRDLALADAEGRIVNDLLREGTKQENGTVLVKRKTHELLAQRLGLSRETVTKALGRLKERGQVEIDKQRNFLVRV